MTGATDTIHCENTATIILGGNKPPKNMVLSRFLGQKEISRFFGLFLRFRA